MLLNNIVSKATAQASLASGFNKFDNYLYLCSSNFESAFVSTARFSITFGFVKLPICLFYCYLPIFIHIQHKQKRVETKLDMFIFVFTFT